MRQSFDRAVDATLTDQIRKGGVDVGKGIRVKMVEGGQIFGMIIPGVSVPTDWAAAAFSHSARRHDFGCGPSSYMVWLVPVAGMATLKALLPVLISHIEMQDFAAAAQKRPTNVWGSSLAIV